MPLLTHVKRKKHLANLEAAFKRMPAASVKALGPDKAAFTALQARIHGYMVFPGDPNYAADTRGNTLYPDLPAPQVIVYCEIEPDIAWCLRFCLDNGWQFSIRSGGHSTAAYSISNGMLIDISLIEGVFVDTNAMVASVQAGASLGKLNMALKPYNLHVPGGECDTVGVAGHMQGGGYGFTSRTFGLNLDAVQSIRVMLADGGIVYADRDTNADLFWAVRGGTGGNFGVLLQVDYNLATLGNLWGVVLQWTQAQAPQVLTMLQQNFMRTGATPNLGYQCAVSTVNGATCLMMMCMFNGSRAAGLAVLKPLLSMGPPKVLLDKVGAYEDLNSELIDSWFAMPPDNTMEVKTCAYVDTTLQPAEWADILAYFSTTPNPFNMFAMEIYGGAVSRVPANDCAFIHRAVDFDLFIDSFCNDNWPYNDEAEAKAWLAGFSQKLMQYYNGERYQNYPDPTNTNYRLEYWGANYDSLVWVKNKYDPTNFFNYPQSIGGPATAGKAKGKAPAKGKGAKTPKPPFKKTPKIVYEKHAGPGMLTRGAPKK